MTRLLPIALALAAALTACGESPRGASGEKAIATRAAELPALDTMNLRGRDDTLLHQDDWRQLEFYPADRRPELEQALKALKASQGVYVRTLKPSVTIAGRRALAELDKTLQTRSAAAPFLSHDNGKVSGQVRSGFTVPLKGVVLYGQTDYEGVSVLGAELQNEDGFATLAETFGRLNKAHGLIAVNWRSQTLFTALKEDGTLDVWRP